MHLEFKEYIKTLPVDVVLPDLEYTYKEVSHIMQEEMLILHYTKLHQGYINRYNQRRKDLEVLSLDSSKLTPKDQEFLCFNLGGYVNHAFFWKSFSPRKEDHVCSADLTSLVNTTFGSTKNLADALEAAVPSIMGSGWIWLLYCKDPDTLSVEITKDQVFPLEGVPLLNIDMWEHAYYLQYKVDKIEYVRTLIASLNWKFASDRFAMAKAPSTK